ncbi:MAG: hypothetical protein ABSH50_07405 [Bryobacteraceae bacterium]
MRRIIVTSGLAVVCFLALRSGLRLRAQSAEGAKPPAWNPAAQQILIRYGVTDTATRTWRGWIEPVSEDARVIGVAGYHFQNEDQITTSDSGAAEFSFSTRAWTPYVQQVDLSPVLPGPRAVFPNGAYATVAGSPAARFHVLGAGNFTFALGDLANRKQLTFDNGNIEVELSTYPFTASNAGEADFPAVAVGSAGRIAVAWQEFMGEQDRIVSREWNGGQWSAAEVLDVTETRDVLRPAAGYDGAGALHVVWAAQVDGNWDLYERRKSATTWSAVERLTTAEGSDFNPRVATDSRGDLWLAWQAFRNGQSDIYAKKFHGGQWQREMRVSESPANDWDPAITADGSGTVWIGWDSYDRGNYDVFVRSFSNGQPGAIRAITHSPRMEAHASLACDKEGHLWIAFDEAEANWGKDYGYLVKTTGNPLYQSRKVRVLRLSGDLLEEPDASWSAAFPLYLPRFVQNPQIAVTVDGKVALAALQLTKSNSVIEVWGVNGIWENTVFTLDGAGWHRSQTLPQSAGANDVRVALAAAPDGKLWAAWAADNRDLQTAKPGRQTVFAAAVPQEPAAGEIRFKPFVERPELSAPTHPNEAADVRAIRDYRMQAGGSEYRILRGDLHRHTSLSTDGVGDGSLWDFYRYALDAASLDFSTVTDHQGGATSYNWWKTQKSCDLFLVTRRLTTLYAYERSVVYPNGHRNIVLTHRGIPILPIDPAEQTGPDKPGTMRSSTVVWPYLRKYDGIAFRHTTATDQGTDWQDHDNTLEPMVEVYQGHRESYEHEGGPRGETAEKFYTQRSGYRPAGFIWNALAKGYRIGFEAASDHCSTHISYSCILATGTSRQDLVDAMRKRHSYGATDNIVLDFRVEADGREYLQGDEIPSASQYELRVNAIGTGPIRRVDVIHNEAYTYEVTPTGQRRAQFSYVDAHPVAGENRYYVRVEQEDGNLAWSSPVWIQKR